MYRYKLLQDIFAMFRVFGGALAVFFQGRTFSVFPVLAILFGSGSIWLTFVLRVFRQPRGAMSRGSLL